jgi:hypothetical protein
MTRQVGLVSTLTHPCAEFRKDATLRNSPGDHRGPKPESIADIVSYSLQLLVFFLCFNQNGNIRVGVFPERDP